ncbi:MAG: copper-translocating P-type ATPase [Dehalococcoidia bacterium]|nr:copper-translocating P-type ATPase [Dehalococcoidia bacterium]
MPAGHDHSQHDHSQHGRSAPEPMTHGTTEHDGHAPGGPAPVAGALAPRAEHGGHGGHASGSSHPSASQHEPAHSSHAGHQGHDKHAGHDPEAFRRLFWLSLVLTIPTVVFSDMIQHWFGYSLSWVPGHALVAPVLGTVVFLYGGRVFLRGGLDEVRLRQPGMMLLISLAITVAFASSVAFEFGWVDLDFWWELAALVTVMLLGHWQEMRALGLTRGALAALAELLPDDAELVDGDVTRIVGIAELRAGDIVLVRPGARVPADGTVEAGQADFDESMLTGESRPVLRQQGERVAAATVALGSSVRVRVDAVGDDTALAGIQRLVAQAQQSRSRAQAIADRAAALLFWVAIGAGLATFAVWSLLGDLDEAIARTVTVLVIACPHALGLAIPLVIAISTEVSARNGILVKDRLALERTRNLDVVLFDKTGTLTLGRPKVTGLWAADGDEERLLRLAGSVEAESEHPLARAIVDRAREDVVLSPVSSFVADPGRGVRGVVEDVEVEVVGPRRLRERNLDVPGAGAAVTSPWQERGATVLYLLRDGQVAGALALEDQARPESREAVEALHALGVRVAMVTGDARSVAEAVARDLGIDEVFAEVLPEHKAEQVVALQQRGLRVAMVGDGVNDAPALAQADVGLAIGAGTDVAIESAGVVLASDDPRSVVGVIRLSAASYRKMVQNLVWATGYNVIAIPLAAGVLAWAGFVMPPALGAVFMSLSTIIVAVNAQLLRRVDLRAGFTS